MVAELSLPYGPLMVDVAGLKLTDFERQYLQHPLVGGVILFARNYECPEQLRALCDEIHGLRKHRLPIAIDHEGGRVQRCKSGFTKLPAMRQLGVLWDKAPEDAIKGSEAIGFILAAELLDKGIDFSFTPVLDLDWGRSGVIGDRSFHSNPCVVSELANALIKGLNSAGMGACGKHFPGHGWVEADSHVAIPIDERSFEEIATDMTPYTNTALDAVMPAHVIYPKVDCRPAGFSSVWINKLRIDLGFKGVIFSDDLSMAGAGIVGDIVARVTAAWNAGCDMLLVCNDNQAVMQTLENWHPTLEAEKSQRIERLLPSKGITDLAHSEHYAEALGIAKHLELIN